MNIKDVLTTNDALGFLKQTHEETEIEDNQNSGSAGTVFGYTVIDIFGNHRKYCTRTFWNRAEFLAVLDVLNKNAIENRNGLIFVSGNF